MSLCVGYFVCALCFEFAIALCMPVGRDFFMQFVSCVCFFIHVLRCSVVALCVSLCIQLVISVCMQFLYLFMYVGVSLLMGFVMCQFVRSCCRCFFLQVYRCLLRCFFGSRCVYFFIQLFRLLVIYVCIQVGRDVFSYYLFSCVVRSFCRFVFFLCICSYVYLLLVGLLWFCLFSQVVRYLFRSLCLYLVLPSLSSFVLSLFPLALSLVRQLCLSLVVSFSLLFILFVSFLVQLVRVFAMYVCMYFVRPFFSSFVRSFFIGCLSQFFMYVCVSFFVS